MVLDDDDQPSKKKQEKVDRPLHLKIPISYDRWQALDQLDVGEAVERVQQLGIDEIRMRSRYEESELELVAQDDLFQSTCRASYIDALDRAKHPGVFARGYHIPKHLKVQYHRPGSRDERNRPTEN